MANEIATIARPYSKALFDIALKDTASLEDWEELVSIIGQTSKDLEAHQPLVFLNADTKVLLNVLTRVLGTEPPKIITNFIKLLSQNYRLTILPTIAEQFRDLKDNHEGIIRVDIVSAFELTEKQLHELKDSLELKFRAKTKIHTTVNRDIIGGIRINIGDYVIDSSVQGQLSLMRSTLTA